MAKDPLTRFTQVPFRDRGTFDNEIRERILPQRIANLMIHSGFEVLMNVFSARSQICITVVVGENTVEYKQIINGVSTITFRVNDVERLAPNSIDDIANAVLEILPIE